MLLQSIIDSCSLGRVHIPSTLPKMARLTDDPDGAKSKTSKQRSIISGSGVVAFVTGSFCFRETLLYRGGVVSSFFITVCSLSYSYRTPSREVLASLRGRRDGRHMMGSEGEAEQSEHRPAEAEPCFPANSPRPSSPRGVRLRRSGTQDSYVMSLRCQPPCASGIPSRPPTCGA